MSYLDVALEHIGLARGERTILRDITWRVRPGQRWVLLGHNGAGKTQLLKLLAGDVWPTPSARSRRRYRLARRVRGAARAATFDQPLGIKERIAYIGAERQDKYARYGWNLTVGELIGTGITGTDIVLEKPDRAGRTRVAQLTRRFGLQGLARRKLMTTSYGERRLALIARALASNPLLLLLDEAFNGLDAPRRAHLMRFLDASGRSRLPWVLAVHRREDVPDSATHLIVLENGRVRFAGRRREALLERAFGKTGRAPVRSAGRASKLTKGRAKGRTKERTKRGPTPFIVLRDVDVFVDHAPVLQGISWTIGRGENWAVLGRNGSGKSTLLRVLYGDLPPALGGAIERAGFVRGTPIAEFKRTVGYLSPELQSDHARDDLTVDEIVISGRHASIGLNEAPSAADRRAAARWLDFFALRELAACRPRELSYGQMRRVLLARAMTGSPRMLLLDEPCTGLDVANRAAVLAHLEQLAGAGVQLVMATHHADDIVPASDRVLRLEKGRVRAQERRAGQHCATGVAAT